MTNSKICWIVVRDSRPFDYSCLSGSRVGVVCIILDLNEVGC